MTLAAPRPALSTVQGAALEHRAGRSRFARIKRDPAQDGGEPPPFASTLEGADGLAPLRAEWRRLAGETLPAAAAARSDWPVRLDHCFARIVLDAVCGRPWREVVRAPAWRHLDEARLGAAVALARRIAAGEADLHALNARSLEMRGKLRRRP